MEHVAVHGQFAASDAEAVEREMEILCSAIRMVAWGRSTRVVVAGIRFGALLLARSRQAGLESGVRLASMSNATGDGVDLCVEQIAA